MAGFKNKRGIIGICLALAVVTLVVYLPATRNGFVNFDDNEYIIDNPHVTAGLTWQGMAWALRVTGYASNWHPLTWMTHMLDCQIYGLYAGGHHLTNVLLHVADSVLVLLLLYQMTGARWRSALVAALFAWHPLHVESVAWASERKDVLSTLFWLLTMLAYVKYARERDGGNSRYKAYYSLALICFVLGLMSKPMLVTLPCVLLLIDFWPLNRIYDSKAGDKLKTLAGLILEKALFFLLALGASLITYRVQQTAGAMSSFEELSLRVRAGNAVQAYLQYLSKTFWPANLAAFYPYSKHQSAVLVILCGVLLAVLSGLFVLAARRRPYLVTGWFWYLGTLVPTIGLVQVGSQAMADRYMYIPSIGFFVLVVWGLDDFLANLPRKRELFATAATVALAGCLAATWFQIQYWHDSQTLFYHAIEATTDNYVALTGYGGALDEAGEPAKAMLCYETAVEISPRYPEGQYNLGTALLNQGRPADAITHFNAALAVNPKYVPAHVNLGKALMQLGHLDEARTQLALAVELKPDYAQSHYNLGTLLLAQGKMDDAIAQFTEALRLKPDYTEALWNLGVTLMRTGRATEGIARLSEAVRLKPNEPGPHANLGVALLEQNRPEEAAAQFGAVLRLKPNDVAAHVNLAKTLARQHKTKEAAGHYREALRLKPDFVEALDNLAWMLSTDPDPQLRDGKEAVQLAKKACELTQNQQANPLLTLAAACAETGQFGEATAKAQQARELATAAGQQEVAERSGNALKLFQAGQPFRETK